MKSIQLFMKYFMKILLRKWPISFILLITIIIGINGQFNPFSEEKYVQNIKLLFTISDSVQVEQPFIHNQYLVNALLQHLSIASDIELSEKDARIQARLFYVTILTALFSLFYRNKKGIVVIILLITIMYLFDIHLLDLQWRQHQSAVLISNAKDSLVNMNSSNTNYYYIHFDSLKSYKKELDGNERDRKLDRTISPIFEQIIFYILPLISFLVSYFVIQTNYLRIGIKTYRNYKRFRRHHFPGSQGSHLD